MCAEVIQAPVELILRVLVSSINSAPDTSVPLTKTGTCRRMRGERRVDEVCTRCCRLLRMSISKRSRCLSTKDLVRHYASGMPEDKMESLNKCFIINRLQDYSYGNNLLSQASRSGIPLPFLKCANGTLLPLTLRGPSVTMPPRENFYHFSKGAESIDGRMDCYASDVGNGESVPSSSWLRSWVARHDRETDDGSRAKRQTTTCERPRRAIPRVSRIRDDSRFESV